MTRATTLPILAFLCALSLSLPAVAQPLGGTWGTAAAEAEFYRIVDLPIPDDLPIEVGSFDILPDGRLAIGTRRGDIYLAEGAFDKLPNLRMHRFARGLDEVFGLGYRDGSFYVTQQAEVTRISDVDQDGRADLFETLSDEWGFEHYHEFSWGSRPDDDGNIWVVLGLSSSYHYRAHFRGWAMKITPEGRTIPIASGVRSAGGVAPNEHGVMFYTESQGPWNGSCSLKHLKPGGFVGHPISFDAYAFAPQMGPRPIEPNTGSRLFVEAARVKQLVPYAVVFPYRTMGQSISGFRVDRTKGKFGPFADQIFVSDYSLSCIMRATTEKVNGVWQGACYPFREGLSTGLLAVQFSPKGYLVAGGTNRGWPVRGHRQYSLERLEWTGRVPFEIHHINVLTDGFRIHFTKEVDRNIAAKPETYALHTFTHIFHKHYGSPEVDQETRKVTSARVSDDGMSVDISLDKLVKGHVHAFDIPGMQAADSSKILHSKAYYTVNEIPVDEVQYKVQSLSKEQCDEYKLDPAFYKKGTMVEGILIATSDHVADLAHHEAAYQFGKVMRGLNPEVAKRIRERGVLCVLIGHDELTSELPQFGSDKTGEELDFYNWRSRGFLTWKSGRPTVVFAEEDVLEYEGGMKLESILIHEFGHVIQGAGFDEDLQDRLSKVFANAKEQGRWMDGRAAQRFRRVTSADPVSLLGSLSTAFPDQPRDFLAKCLDAGDILVNGQASHSGVQVNRDDKVVIVFGGEKECYAHRNKAEYWAEGVQCWYDTNRTMDHDHNHIHTRVQLETYDPELAALCAEVLGTDEWRFVSPRDRAGEHHLRDFDPKTAPRVIDKPHIKKAANDYYDKYWKDFWKRLHKKHEAN